MPSSVERLLLFVSFLFWFFIQPISAEGLVPVSNPEHIYGPRSILRRRDDGPTGELDLLNAETFYWAAPCMFSDLSVRSSAGTN